MAPKTQIDNSYKIKTVLTIVFLFSTLIAPLLGVVGVILMWLWMQWKRWVKILITAPFVFYFILAPLVVYTYVFGFQPIRIYGNAMLPQYKSGQKYIERVLHKSETLKRGDVVIVNQPDNLKNVSLKRIIGLPGEKLLLQDGKVHIFGTVLDESEYLLSSTTTHELLGMGTVKEGEEYTIPADSYFVMGDNRSISADSRVYGAIPRASVLGKPWFCYSNCK